MELPVSVVVGSAIKSLDKHLSILNPVATPCTNVGMTKVASGYSFAL